MDNLEETSVTGEVVNLDKNELAKEEGKKKLHALIKKSKFSIFVSIFLIATGNVLSISCATVYLVMLSTGMIFWGFYGDSSGKSIAAGAFWIVILFSIGMLLMLIGGIIAFIDFSRNKKAIKYLLEVLEK